MPFFTACQAVDRGRRWWNFLKLEIPDRETGVVRRCGVWILFWNSVSKKTVDFIEGKA
jgi:hypothetical protein